MAVIVTMQMHSTYLLAGFKSQKVQSAQAEYMNSSNIMSKFSTFKKRYSCKSKKIFRDYSSMHKPLKVSNKTRDI